MNKKYTEKIVNKYSRKTLEKAGEFFFTVDLLKNTSYSTSFEEVYLVEKKKTLEEICESICLGITALKRQILEFEKILDHFAETNN